MHQFTRFVTRLLVIVVLLLASITVLFHESLSALSAGNTSSPAQFKDYWHQGKAEITRYELEQVRYGEIHKGDAVLIFVTEPFLTDKQVKHEFGEDKNSAGVLKLNFTRNFNTGIYPYSMMTSTFTPIDTDAFPRTLKATTTVQEWCGHVFQQLNLRDSRYKVEIRSYFQKESDRDYNIGSALLEDEIWTMIRLKPEALPIGIIEIIPGGQFVRMSHIDLKVESAHTELNTISDPQRSEKELHEYTVKYLNIKRTLKIRFEKEFPYKIVAWEETSPSGFGPDAIMLTTKARATNSLYTDYWTKNKIKHSPLRKELGLD